MDEFANFSSETYSPDNLCPEGNPDGKKVTILSGAGALVRGTLLGKIALGAVSEDHAGNTGDGAMGAITLGSKAKAGDYVLTCVEAVENAGRFQVVDPDGVRLADLTVGVAYSGNHLNMTLADGDADFIVGDVFTVTVAEGSGKYQTSLAAAVDGSQEADVILANDADASAADAEALVYFAGKFNSGAMTFGAGHTADSVWETLRAKGIYLAGAAG